jgi:hypothetical protein
MIVSSVRHAKRAVGPIPARKLGLVKDLPAAAAQTP